MVAWLHLHWELIALVAGVLISILNAATTHWSEHTGAVKVLLWIVDCLSLIRSKGTEGSTLGNAKLPGPTGSSGVVDGKLTRAAIPLLLGAALMAGCICTTPRACLVTAHKAIALADGPALKAIGDKCLAEATKCGPVGTDKCPAWQKCDAARKTYRAALDGIDAGLAGCNRVLSDLEVK